MGLVFFRIREVNFDRQTIDATKIPSAARHKWGDLILSEGFVPFPKTLLRTLLIVLEGGDLELLQVVLAVIDYDRPNLRNYPSAAYLSHLAGMPEERFMHRVADLVRMGLAQMIGDAANLHVNLGPLKNKISAVLAEEKKSGGGTQGV